MHTHLPPPPLDRCRRRHPEKRALCSCVSREGSCLCRVVYIPGLWMSTFPWPCPLLALWGGAWIGEGKSQAEGRAPIHLVRMVKLIVLTGVGATWGRGGALWVPVIQRPREEHCGRRQEGVYRKKANAPGAEGNEQGRPCREMKALFSGSWDPPEGFLFLP